MSETPSEISIRTTSGLEITTVELVGEIDLFTSTRVNLEFELVLGREPLPRTIVVDVANVGFIDSIGLAVLLTARQQAELAGCRLLVTALSPALARLFDISGLTQLLTDNAE